MKRWAKQVYPLLLAVFPALDLAAGNPGEYELRDLFCVLATIAVVLLAFQACLHTAVRLTGRRQAASYVPVFVAALVAWSFLYMPLYNRAHAMSHGLVVHWQLLMLGLLVTILVLRYLGRREERLEACHRFGLVLGGILVVLPATRIAIAQVRSARTIARSSLAHELGRPLRTIPAADGTTRSRPDIYFILLDMYASSAVMRERYQFDNRPFEDSLRALGFTVVPGMRSNYNQTRQSLPSMLNFSHVTRIERELVLPRDASLSYYLLRHNRLATFLRSQGYRFVFFPSGWWPGTHSNDLADVRFDGWKGSGFKGQLARSDLRRHLSARTPLALLDLSGTDFGFAQRTFEGLAHAADLRRPTFVFAHLLLPHPPFIVDADCRPGSRTLPSDSAAAVRAYAGQYFDQLQCTNRLVLDLVRTLMRRSASPPIIVLQGDHGATSLEPLALDPRAPRSGAEARAEFGALGAYYLPQGGAAALGTQFTPVNLFRDILAHYLGLDLPREPDSLFYLSGLKYPNHFFRIPQSLLDTP
jgi:hypothetical protein